MLRAVVNAVKNAKFDKSAGRFSWDGDAGQQVGHSGTYGTVTPGSSSGSAAAPGSSNGNGGSGAQRGVPGASNGNGSIGGSRGGGSAGGSSGAESGGSWSGWLWNGVKWVVKKGARAGVGVIGLVLTPTPLSNGGYYPPTGQFPIIDVPTNEVVIIGNLRDEEREDNPDYSTSPVPWFPATQQNRGPLYYVTYTKTNIHTGEVYVGRSRGYGDPFTVVINRDKNHHKDKQDFGPAVLDEFTIATLSIDDRHRDPAYQAIRGREQLYIDHLGGCWNDVGRGNTNSGNDINGIYPLNPLKEIYMMMGRTLGPIP